MRGRVLAFALLAAMAMYSMRLSAVAGLTAEEREALISTLEGYSVTGFSVPGSGVRITYRVTDVGHVRVGVYFHNGSDYCFIRFEELPPDADGFVDGEFKLYAQPTDSGIIGLTKPMIEVGEDGISGTVTYFIPSVVQDVYFFDLDGWTQVVSFTDVEDIFTNEDRLHAHVEAFVDDTLSLGYDVSGALSSGELLTFKSHASSNYQLGIVGVFPSEEDAYSVTNGLQFNTQSRSDLECTIKLPSFVAAGEYWYLMTWNSLITGDEYKVVKYAGVVEDDGSDPITTVSLNTDTPRLTFSGQPESAVVGEEVWLTVHSNDVQSVINFNGEILGGGCVSEAQFSVTRNGRYHFTAVSKDGAVAEADLDVGFFVEDSEIADTPESFGLLLGTQGLANTGVEFRLFGVCLASIFAGFCFLSVGVVMRKRRKTYGKND